MNNDMAMFSFHARIETFSQWPHTDCNCTPEKVKLFNISKYFLEKTIILIKNCIKVKSH